MTTRATYILNKLLISPCTIDELAKQLDCEPFHIEMNITYLRLKGYNIVRTENLISLD